MHMNPASDRGVFRWMVRGESATIRRLIVGVQNQAMGNGQWAMGNGQWAMGNGQWETGIRHQ